jgi:hypothetical protein
VLDTDVLVCYLGSLSMRSLHELYILQEIKAVALKFLLVIFLCIIVVAGLYLLWKGVYRLSDWMNDMEEQRARQRHLKPGRL